MVESRALRILLAGSVILLGFVVAMLIFSSDVSASVNLNGGMVTPGEGTSSTVFKYTVIYYNTDNVSPDSIIVRRDMDAGHVMLVDPAATAIYRDGNFSNGEQYYNMSTLGSGSHFFSFEATQGAYNDIYGPILGPVVNDPPELYSPGVTPSPGKSTDIYHFEVMYRDPNGDLPTITILIKSATGQNIFTVIENNGASITAGRKYYYNTTLAPGSYEFNFTASDGKFTVSLPLASGPIVNHIPTLTQGAVNPTFGTSATEFNYTVVYTDEDNNEPMEIKVVIDGTSYSMSTYDGTAPVNGRLYYFTTASIPGGLGEGNHTFTFSAKDSTIGESAIPPALQHYPVVNYKPRLSLASMSASKSAIGGIYPSNTMFNFSISYRDNDDTAPVYMRVYIGGIPYEMAEVDPADGVYSDGKLYYYRTTITPGDIDYYFAASDGMEGCATAPAQVRVNAVPTVVIDVSPDSGIATTSFTFTATVTDMNGQLPTEVKIFIDDNVTGVNMLEDDALDMNVTDGKSYSYTTLMLPGYHNYKIMVNDSIERIYELATGPRVNHAPTLSNSVVTPTTGNTSTKFNFTVTYTDMDNTAPAYIRLTLDGTNVYDLLPSSAADTNYADGKEYYYAISGLAAVPHTYSFEAYDGQEYVTSALREGPEVLVYNVNLAPYFGVDADVHIDMEQGNATTFELIVQNTGTADDVYSLASGGDNPQYVSALPSSLSLDATENGRFNITITIPTTESPTEHSFTITVTSNTDPATPRVSDTLRFVIHVKPVHNIKVSLIGTNESTVDTGARASYKFRVENLGSTGEFIWINFTGINSAWAEPIDPNPSAFAAFGAPGYYHDFYLNISIPVSASPITFTTYANISIQNFEYRAYSLAFKTTIRPTYHVNLTYITPEYNYTADPGTPLSVQFYLENVGTIHDSYTIALSTTDPNWTVGSVSDISNVDINELRTVTMAIVVPPNALKGWHDVNITVRSVANTSVNNTILIKVNVSQVHMLDIVEPFMLFDVVPGGVASVKFNVTNLGNGIEEIHLAPYFYPAMFTPSISPSTITLLPLETKAVTLTLAVDGGAAPGEFMFQINGTCDEPYIADTIMMVANVSNVYSLQVSSQSYTNSTLPGASAGFSVSIKNTGNCNETFRVSLELPPALSSSFTTTTVTIAHGNTSVINFIVNANANSATGDYRMFVNVTSLSKPSVNTSKEYTLTVRQVYLVDAQYSAGTVAETINVSSGKTYTMQIKIWNMGNGIDMFNLASAGSNAWWVSIAPSQVTLPASEYTTATVTIIVPMGVNNGTHNIIISATSAGNASIKKDLTLAIVVVQTYGVEASCSAPNPPAISPSESITFAVEVRNAGDGLDIVDIFKSGSFAQYAVLSVNSLTLNPGQSGTVNVTVTVPADAKVGAYLVDVGIVSRGNNTHYANVTLTPSVAQVYGLSVICMASTDTGVPGGYSNFSVTVKNLGNGPDSFSIVALNSHLGWGASVLNATGVPVSTIALASGAQENLVVVVNVPSSIGNGDYITTVNATSVGSPLKYSYAVLHTTINLVYSVSLTSAPASQCAPGSSVVYHITVRNNGNIRDMINIALTGGNVSWASLDNTSATLNPGETKQIGVTFSVPLGTTNNDYFVEVTATSVGNSSAKSTAILTTTVLVNYGIGLSAVGGITSQLCSPGSYVDFQLRVNNTSDVGANVLITLIGVSETGDTTATLPAGVDTIYAGAHSSALFTVRISVGANAESKNAVYKAIVSLTGVPQPLSAYLNITTIVQRNYDIEASCAQTQQYAGLGDTVYYVVSVQNRGNVNDSNIVVTIQNDPYSWANIQGSNIFALAPSAVKDVLVRVTVPTTWTNSVSYQFVVNVNGSGNRNDKVTLTTVVSFSSRLSSPKNSTNMLPGTSQRLNFTVTNTGTGNDTIQLRVQAADVLAWIALDSSSVSLAPGQSTTVFFTITVPTGQSEGKYTFKIIANSLWDTSRTSTQDYAVNVNKISSLDITSAVLAKDASPGTDVVYTFTVQNTGNGVSTISPITAVAPEGWSAMLSIMGFTLNPGEQRTVTLTVTVPQNEVVCTKTISVTAVADAGVGQASKAITFTANVKQTNKATIALSDATVSAEPGETAVNVLTIRNTGNGLESFNLSVGMTTDWLVNDYVTSFTLPAGESKTITLKFDVPSDLTVARAGEYSVNVTVKYAGNEKTLTTGCKLVVTPVYKLSLSADVLSKTQNIEDRADVQYTIRVTNYGNDRDLVTMQADMPTAFTSYSFTPNQQALEPLQTIDVVLRIPYTSFSSLLIADHTITVSAKSIDQTLSPSIKLNLSVKGAELDVQSSSIQLSKTSISKDGTITVTASIKNNGGAPAKNVVVRFYDEYESDGEWVENLIGSATISEIGVGATQSASIDWTVTEVGNHKVKVKLEGADSMSASVLSVKGLEKSAFADLASPALMIGLVIGFIIGMVVLVGARGGTKPKGPMPSEKPSASLPDTVAPDTESKPEPETETIHVAKPPEAEQPAKIARVKCPKCGEIKDVTSPVRPIEVQCSKCGTKMRLKH